MHFCNFQTIVPHKGEIDAYLALRIMSEAFEIGVRRTSFYTIGDLFMCSDIETHVANAKNRF